MSIPEAVILPIDDCAFTISIGSDGTWLNFSASNGKFACIRVESLAEKSGHIVGAALLGWCKDRASQADEIRSNNGHFGVGA